MSQALALKIKGLNTNSNQYSSPATDGALAIANNIAISKPDIAESRRGFDFLTHTLPLSTDRADKLLQYQNKLIVHYNTSQMGYYDEATGFHAYTGTFAHPDPVLGRIWSAEASQNLYFTSATGIQKLDSISSTPTQAGMQPGLDVKASPSTNASGWMTNNSQVAYRVIFGLSDLNNNLVIGAPSQRAVIANATGGNQDVSLQFTLPDGITTNHIFQVYRSNLSASSTTVPDDNCQLVFGRNPTSAEITAKSVTIIDVTPDSLKGAALYTNDSQQGILQSNDMPPFAYDMAAYRECLFFGNTLTNQSLILNIEAVGGASGIQLADTIAIDGIVYTAGSSENISTRTYALVTTGSVSQNIADTSQSLVRVINRNTSNTTIYARYLSTATSLPGQIQLFKRVIGGSAFSITASAHGSAFSPVLPTSGTSVSSTNSQNLNGLMYSKQGIPEAVPTINILYVGSAAKKILRLIALRDSLMILKEDGLYRLTGTAPGNFVVDLVDSSAILVAPETAVAVNNTIICLGQQGVLQITDTEAKIISEPIEDTIRPLLGDTLTTLSKYGFGVSYETDRKYLLWLVSNEADTYATGAIVYDLFTKTWVTWTRPEVHGLVLKGGNDRIFVCNPSTNKLSVERKSWLYTDFADEPYDVTVISVSGTTLSLSTVLGVTVGDMVYISSSISSIITDVDTITNSITVVDDFSWSPGPMTFLKGIPVLMEWLPFATSNPGQLKHFRECSVIFKQNYFNNASLNFYTELSGSIEKVPFTGTSLFGWGRFAWGTGAPWGGASRPTNFRTYIPADKQRCDFLSLQFECSNVWARFQIQGLSLILNSVSERVAR